MSKTGAWKQFESKVARLFGTRRNPLSGKMSGHGTSSDTLHRDFYIECKWLSGEKSAGAATLSIWDDVVKEAKKEGKLPVLVMHRRSSRIEFAAIPLTIAVAALNCYLEHSEVTS